MYISADKLKIIGKFQNFPVLTAANHEMSSREHSMKVLAPICNQLQAPVYSNMMNYAWFAARLVTSCEIFISANQVVFPHKTETV